MDRRSSRVAAGTNQKSLILSSIRPNGVDALTRKWMEQLVNRNLSYPKKKNLQKKAKNEQKHKRMKFAVWQFDCVSTKRICLISSFVCMCVCVCTFRGDFETAIERISERGILYATCISDWFDCTHAFDSSRLSWLATYDSCRRHQCRLGTSTHTLGSIALHDIWLNSEYE